jgi:uncharacterized protein YlxW (UPF0749 family)
MPDAPSTPRGRVDGSMSLLVDMTAAALDPAYADVAARRTGPDAPTPARAGGRRPRSALLLLLLLAVGLVTGIAAAQVRRGADDAGSVRRSLVADVQRQTAQTDRLAMQADRLRREVAQVRTQALGAGTEGQAASARVAALELVTGAVAVRGPGLVVTLDDAPDVRAGATASRGGQLGDGRVYDRDLQDVVNALWAAGAEAVSINGQRLTSRTAIRSAGEAILVDFRPLNPPYLLRAVGNVDTMEPTFVDGTTARRFQTWTSLYGIGFEVARAGDLRLPAAGTPDLRLATPGGAP